MKVNMKIGMINNKILGAIGLSLLLIGCSYKHAYQPIAFSGLDTQANYETLTTRYANGQERQTTESAEQKELF